MMSITPAQWRAFARAHRAVRADACLLSCTAVRSAEVADALEAEFDRPVVTSNTAAVWHCLRKMALPDRVDGYGRLLREH
jgi:maleate isomerase